MFKPYLIATSPQKILDFLISHPEQSFYGTELAKKLKLSKGGVNKALQEFQKKGILEKDRKGKTDLYFLKDDQPIIRQLKVLSTLLKLESLLEELKTLTRIIILYGSSSKGSNDQQSDIDLLIVTTSADKAIVEESIYTFQEKEKDLPKIQASIKTTIQWNCLEDKDPVYFQEVVQGITLWNSLQSYDHR